MYKRQELKKSDAAFITETNNKGFRIKTAGLYCCIHFILVFWTFYYLHDTHGKHENIKQWFRNYDFLGSGYDIAITCILIFSILILSFWYKFAKSVAGFGLIFLILLCYGYLIGYILRLACKASVDWDEEICKGYVALWCAGFGMLIAACIPSRDFKRDLGIGIGSVMFGIMLILWRYAYCLDNPPIIETMIYIIGFWFYSWYINTTLLIMVTKRVHLYTSKDWTIAFGHLQTDIFCMFWIDLCKTKKNKVIDEQVMENDFDIKIGIRGDEPERQQNFK